MTLHSISTVLAHHRGGQRGGTLWRLPQCRRQLGVFEGVPEFVDIWLWRRMNAVWESMKKALADVTAQGCVFQ